MTVVNGRVTRGPQGFRGMALGALKMVAQARGVQLYEVTRESRTSLEEAFQLPLELAA